MSYERGDIVDVYFDLPYTTKTKTHPAIIISNEDVYNTDTIYICVMMTSSTEFKDIFTFDIEQNMLMFPNNKGQSQARCHLITYIKDNHISQKNKNSLKESAVNRLIERINEVSFSFE